MNRNIAAEIKQHLEQAVCETSSAATTAKEHCTATEFAAVQLAAGEIIATIQDVLHSVVYRQFPDMNDL